LRIPLPPSVARIRDSTVRAGASRLRLAPPTTALMPTNATLAATATATPAAVERVWASARACAVGSASAMTTSGCASLTVPPRTAELVVVRWRLSAIAAAAPTAP
jgi:hypothetical protein